MKRTISIWLGLLVFALSPVFAQTPAVPAAPTGKIHGHVINPTGIPASNGTVSLSVDSGRSYKYTFPLSSNGEYSGEAAPGTYVAAYRQPDTPANQMVDFVEGVKIVVDQDVAVDMDMSRKDFIDKLSPEQRKQLEDIKAKNKDAMKANEIIKTINADLHTVTQDIKDADAARAAATQQLGATAAKTAIDAKEEEIKAAKFGEVESLMQKDTAAKGDASVLWANLGLAQIGLKKYDDAEGSFKKVLELEGASKKPNSQTQGAADAGLGEVYARTGKVPEATAAYDAAAKVNPPQAAMYLKNEAVIFYNLGNAAAQMAAANEAIAIDPAQPMPYYLKGQGLIQSATFDAKTHKIILPPGCADAYQKYLELAPDGPYAGEVKGILDQAGQTVTTTFKAKPAKK